jgi:hypothetical protein
MQKLQPGQGLERWIRVRATPEMARGIDAHARERQITASSWLRGVIVAALKAEGTEVSPPINRPFKVPVRSQQMVHHRVAA